jgi:hypothetical protein
LLAAAKLTGGNIVLHLGDHHWDNGPGLRCTRNLGNHTNLHHLRFNLSKAGVQNALTGARWNQDASRSHQRVDYIAGPQRKLFHATIYAGTDDGLLQFHFGLCQCRFGTRLLSW